MEKSNGSRVAYYGVMSALVFVFLAIETSVLGSLLPISPCYLSLPLAISLSLGKGKKQMFVGGLIFGVSSFILALIFPKFVIFLNPLISILPRVLFGIVAYFVSELFLSLTKKASLSYAVGGVFGAFTNTVLVVFALYIFKFQGLADALKLILSFNALIEIVSSAILTPVFTLTAKKIMKRN